MELYSKIHPTTLTHKIIRKKDLLAQGSRVDYSNPKEPLQISTIHETCKKTFKAHYHLPTKKETTGTQEIWIVIIGTITITCYDIDNVTLLGEYQLKYGDAAITFKGGHSYKIDSDHAIIYEAKTGPYLGTGLDKKYI